MGAAPSSWSELHAVMRRPLPTAVLTGSVLLLSVLPVFPEIRTAIGVGLTLTIPMALMFAVSTIIASIEYHRDQRGTRYWVANHVETFITTVGCAVPIIASGQPASIFWFLFLAVSLHAGTSGRGRTVNLWFVGAGPAIVIGYFLVAGKPGGALIALCIGGIGLYTYAVLSAGAQRLADTIAERDRLAAQLSDLQLQAERARIARDLHDGVGAELAALIWRARRLQAELDREGSSGELRALEERVFAGVDELRAIVWSLRSAPLPLPEWLNQLEERCREMCGEALRLMFTANVTAIPDLLQQPLSRMVWECVRNAVRHANASTISVTMSTSTQDQHLDVVVDDDGIGIAVDKREASKGGLANLQHRATELGGALTIAKGDGGRGTRIAIVVPLLAPAHGKSTA